MILTDLITQLITKDELHTHHTTIASIFSIFQSSALSLQNANVLCAFGVKIAAVSMIDDGKQTPHVVCTPPNPPPALWATAKYYNVLTICFWWCQRGSCQNTLPAVGAICSLFYHNSFDAQFRINHSISLWIIMNRKEWPWQNGLSYLSLFGQFRDMFLFSTAIIK